jgi:diacylglycerol kinase (ATP)
MINTVVEEFIDQLIKEYHEGAKVIKDMSAGFVLITAVTTLIILFLIFGHRIPTLFL